jgi:hypothetical protein
MSGPDLGRHPHRKAEAATAAAMMAPSIAAPTGTRRLQPKTCRRESRNGSDGRTVAVIRSPWTYHDTSNRSVRRCSQVVTTTRRVRRAIQPSALYLRPKGARDREGSGWSMISASSGADIRDQGRMLWPRQTAGGVERRPQSTTRPHGGVLAGEREKDSASTREGFRQYEHLRGRPFCKIGRARASSSVKPSELASGGGIVVAGTT